MLFRKKNQLTGNMKSAKQLGAEENVAVVDLFDFTVRFSFDQMAAVLFSAAVFFCTFSKKN